MIRDLTTSSSAGLGWTILRARLRSIYMQFHFGLIKCTCRPQIFGANPRSLLTCSHDRSRLYMLYYQSRNILLIISTDEQMQH